MRFTTETAVGLFIVAATATFLYMSYQIGSFRLDRIKYSTYYAYFTDISGLSKKSDVKIAGVKVGWVDSVELVSEGHGVKATLLINKQCTLFEDAQAVVRQEGLLGGKYLELNPGDSLLPQLSPGSMLTRPTQGPVVMDQLIRQCKGIASNVESITESMKGALGGPEGEERMRSLVTNLQQAAEKFASVCGSLDRVVGRNEGTLDEIMGDFREVLRELRQEIPKLSASLQQNVGQVATTLDRDFSKMADQLEQIAQPVHEIAHKINDGRGIIGQLIHDESAARDLRVAVNGIKTYFDKVDKLAMIFDIHTESMYGPFEGHKFKDSKAYINLRIHPREDYFYLAGIVPTQSGTVQRFEEHRQWYKGDCEQMVLSEMNVDDNHKVDYAPLKKVQFRRLDQWFFNLQFGKIYGRFAFRFGMFDSTGGLGVDVDIPFFNERLRWVSTFEVFDLNGRNRLGDDRPHFKWLNRMFFTKNIYFVFGADDFVSRHNKNAFFGAGIRFADDDFKYLLSRANINL